MKSSEVIAAFDLSTTCTGVAIASLENNYLKHLVTTPIIPSELLPSDLGYLSQKQKVTTKKGEVLRAYVTSKTEVISKTEKKRRDSAVRKAREEHRLKATREELHRILRQFEPNLILMEQNMAFRSMDVTRALAEIAGSLQAFATAQDIEVVKINVHTARSKWDVYNKASDLAKRYTPAELKKMDIVKETVKFLLLEKYGHYPINHKMTTDESDALLLLDYYLDNERGITILSRDS